MELRPAKFGPARVMALWLALTLFQHLIDGFHDRDLSPPHVKRCPCRNRPVILRLEASTSPSREKLRPGNHVKLQRAPNGTGSPFRVTCFLSDKKIDL